jgi:5-methylcytosine-specific restriction endonuclease McrA
MSVSSDYRFAPSHRRWHLLLDAGADPVCHYCGVPLVCPCDMEPCGEALIAPDGTSAFQLDHVVARSNGGSSRLDNLVPACGPCNVRKGAA